MMKVDEINSAITHVIINIEIRELNSIIYLINDNNRSYSEEAYLNRRQKNNALWRSGYVMCMC